MPKIPCHFVSGQGLGISYSSYTQIGDLRPARSIGHAKVGVFYNAFNGNCIIQDHAVQVDEASGPMPLFYTFNTQASTLETAQCFSLKKRFLTLPDIYKDPADTTAILLESDGHQTVYQKADGVLIYFAEAHGEGRPQLVMMELEGYWQWYDPKTQIEERYDLNGNLTQRIDASGRATQFAYQNGELSSVIGPSGAVYTFERPNQATMAIYSQDPGQAKQLLQTYTYDALGRVVKTALPSGYQLNYEYHANTFFITNAKQSDGTDVALILDFLPNQGPAYPVQIQFNDANDPVMVTVPAPGALSQTISYGAAIGLVFDLNLNADGSVATLTEYLGYATNGVQKDITQFAYNPNKQLASITAPDQSQELFEYEPISFMVQKHTRPNGRVVEYIYHGADTARQPIIIKTEQTENPDHPLITRYVYDENFDGLNENHRFLRFIISPTGLVTEFRPQPNTAFIGEIRHYQKPFDLSHYLPRSAPVILAMNAWVAAQDPGATSLTRIVNNLRGQALTTDEFAAVDATGQGVVTAAMAETNRVWDIHGMCLQRAIRQEWDPQSPAPLLATYVNSFDDLQRLTQEINPLPEDNTTTHQYNNAAQTRTTRLPSGLQLQGKWDRGGCENVSSEIAPSMNLTRTTNTYRNSCDQPLRIESADGTIAFQIFDKQNRLAFTISPMGRVVGFNYDRANRVVTTTQFINTINIANLFIHYPPILPHCLPSVAMFVDTVLPGLQAAQGNIQTYKFNDQSQRLHYEVDALNYVVEHLYDTRSNKLGTIRYANPLSAAELATLKSGGVLARNLDLIVDRYDQSFYDDENRLQGHIDADGWVNEYRYDTYGFLIEKIDYATPNRGPRLPSFAAMRPAAVPASDAHTYYFNNLLGKPELTVDAQGYITVYVYNSRKLLVSQTRFYNPVDPSWYQNVAQKPALPASNPEDRTTTFTYDLMARQIASQCTTQAASEKQFDAVGHTILDRHFDSRDPQNADADKSRATQDQYDQLGQLTNHANPFVARELAQIEFNPNLSPAQKQAQELVIWQTHSRRDIYDPASGLKIQSINSVGGITTYYYDQDRNLAVTISPEGSVLERTVNSFAQEIQTREYSQKFDMSSGAFTGGFRTPAFNQALLAIANADLDIIVNKEPDARGNVTQITDGEGYQKTFAYNAFQEVISEGLPVAGTAPSLIISKTRNPRGLVTAITSTANGQSITEQRQYENIYAKETKFINAAGVEQNQTYDRLGNLSSQSVAGVLLVTSEYDAFKQVKKRTNALGAVTLYDYAQATGTQIIHRPVPETDITLTRNVFSEMISRARGAFSPELWEHAPNGAQEQYTDQVGNETSDAYYLEGWHQSRTLADGTVSTFSRDLEGRLTKEEVQDNTETLIARSAYAPNPLGVNESVTRWTNITNNQSIQTQNAYDRRRLLLSSVQDPSAASYVGLDIKISQAHNGQGTRTSFIQGDVQAVDQFHVNFAQDDFGRGTSKTIDPPTAQNQNALAITLLNKLDVLGRVVMNTDPRGNKNYLFYDQFGNKRFKVNALGAIVEWRYDAQKRRTARIDYDAFSPTPVTEATTLAQMMSYAQTIASKQDSQRYYFYDDNDRPRFNVTINLNSTTQQLEGYVSETQYNAADKRILRRGYAKAIAVENIANWKFSDIVALMAQNTDPQDRITYYLPDAKGQERFSIDPLGAVQQQIFDPRGRIIERIKYANFLANPQDKAQLTPGAFAAQVIPNLESPGRDRISYKVFDNLGKPTFTVDPEGGVVHFDHDAKGRLIYQCEYADKITPAANYDEVVAQILSLQPTPGKDSIKQFNPDKADRVQAVTDALSYVDQFSFFAHGAVATHTDRNQAVFSYQYDRAKRMVLKTSPVVAITDTVFDSEHQQIVATTTQRAVSDRNDYDSANNVTAITKDAGGSTERVFNASFDAENAVAATAVDDVEVDDVTKAASFQTRPVKTQSITTLSVRNAKGSEIVKKSESGLYVFTIYDSANRKIFEVNSLGAVKQYSRNSFGEILCLTEYSQAINLNFAQYQQSGIPLLALLGVLQANPNLDRSKLFTRNLCGLVLTQVSYPAVPCYIPGSNQVIMGNPTLANQYNAFGEVIRIQNLRFPVTANSPAMWTDKLQWYDLNGKYALKVEKIQLTVGTQEVYRATRSIQNAWQLEEDRVQLVTSVAQAPDLAASLDQIDAQLPYSDADRHTRKLYDPRKALSQKIRLNVQRSILQQNPQTGVPSLQTQTVNLVETFSYSPTELLTEHQFANGLSEVMVYNLRGDAIGKMLMPRTAIGPDGKPRMITPLNLNGVNAHGQQTAQTRFKYGADTTAPMPAVPVPLQADAEDQLRLTTFDNRGKNSYRQNAEAVVTGLTYTPSGKVAREFVNQTDFPVPEITPVAVIHVDEKRTGFDLADRTISKTVLRDNVPVQQTFLRVNTFSDVIGEGADPSATDVLRLHDGAGREWSTIDRNPTITLGSLDGKPSLSLQATKTDLSQTTDPLQVNALLNAAYTDVQRSEYTRAPDGRVLQETLPSFDPGIGNTPVNIVLQVAFNNGQLSWPPLQQRSSIPVFSIGVRGGAKQVLPIIYGDELWSVDVSHLPTDIYDLELDYFLIDPRNPQVPTSKIQYITTGSVQIMTNVAGASAHCVSYVEQGHLLYLTGNTGNAAAVELYQNNQLIMQLPLQPDPVSGILFVDTLGKNLPSGTYQVKPVNGAELGLPLTLYTDVPSPTPIAREIYLTSEVQFMVSGQDAELDIWSALPVQYQNSTIGVVIKYVDANGVIQTFECQVVPNSAAQFKRDQNNNIIQPNITLPTVAASISSLSLSIKLSDDEFVIIYNDEVPEGPARETLLSQSTSRNHLLIQTVHSKAYKRGKRQADAEGDYFLLDVPTFGDVQTYYLAQRGIVYLNSVPNFDPLQPQQYEMEYFDVSQDDAASWAKYKSLIVAPRSKGLSIDSSALLPGVYPLRSDQFNLPDSFQFTVARNSFVYASNNVPQARDPSPGLARRRLYEYSVVCKKPITVTDANGNTTVRVYNDHDDVISETSSPVDVQNENGSVTPAVRLTRSTAYNTMNKTVGTTDPKGNVTGIARNEADQQTCTVLPDGSFDTQTLFDGLERPATYTNMAQSSVQVKSDHENSVVALIVPNDDAQINNGQPLVTGFGYDESRRRNKQVDAAGNQTLQNRDPLGNSVANILPGGQVTRRQFGRANLCIQQIDADGVTMTWTPDVRLGYFGLAGAHRDRSGAVYQYAYDFLANRIRSTSSGGNHGNHAEIGTVAFWRFYRFFRANVIKTVPNGAQDLEFVWVAGLLLAVIDNGMQQVSQYGYDAEGNRIMVSVTKFDGSVLRSATMQLDALYRPVTAVDRGLTVGFGHDANDNLIFKIFSLMGIPPQQFFSSVDIANRTLVSEGALVNGVPAPTANQGVQLSYVANRRATQTTIAANGQPSTSNIAYWATGDVQSIAAPGSTSVYHNAPAGGQVSSIVVTDTQQTRHLTGTDVNGWLAGQQQWQGSSLQIDTSSVSAPTGAVLSQTTQDNTSNPPVNYGFSYGMVDFSQQMPSVVTGRSSEKYGTKYTQSILLYDVNGNNNALIGSDQYVQNGDSPAGIMFVTTWEGLILQKAKVTYAPFFGAIQTVVGNYFYTTTGEYLTAYTQDNLETAEFRAHRETVQDRANMELVENEDAEPAPEARTRIRVTDTTTQAQTGVTPVAQNGRVVSLASTSAPTFFRNRASFRSLMSHLQTVKAAGPHFDDMNPLASITNKNFTGAAKVYTVQNGDSFASIAASQMTNALYASTLAMVNGYSSANDTPQVNDQLKIPPYVPFKSDDGTRTPADQIITAIIGPIFPQLQFAQPKQHHSCIKEIIEVVISVVAVLVAPEITAAILGTQLATATAMVADGIAAATVDAGLQGVGVGVGALDHFSTEDVLAAAFGGAIAGSSALSGISSFKNVMTLGGVAKQTAEIMVLNGTESAAEQLSYMALGLQSKFDFKAVAAAMAEGVASSVIGTGFGGATTKNVLLIQVNKALDDVTTAYFNGLIGAAIYGAHADFEGMAIQAIGSYVGQAAGGAINAELAPFVAKRLAQTAAPASHYFAAQTDGRGVSQSPDGYCAWDGRDHSSDDPTNYSSSDYHNSATTPDTKQPNSSTAPIRVNDPQTGVPDWFSDSFNQYMQPVDQSLGFTGASNGSVVPNAQTAAMMSQYFWGGGAGGADSWAPKSMAAILLSGGAMSLPSVAPGSSLSGGGLFSSSTSDLARAKLMAEISKDIYNPSKSFTDAHLLTDAELKQLGLNPSEFTDASQGFYAGLYQLKDGSYVVAYRGSQSLASWGTDVKENVLGEDTAAYQDSAKVARDVYQVTKGNVSFTGHSLGGGEAALAALVTGRQAITFNAAGISDATLANSHVLAASANNLVTSYQVENQILELGQRYFGLPPALGQTVTLPSGFSPSVTLFSTRSIAPVIVDSGYLHTLGVVQKDLNEEYNVSVNSRS